MKFLFTIITALLLSNTLFANESKVCQKCHPIIYQEYSESSHKNASVYNNPIHKAMWEKHPKDEKGYTCAKCHSPSDIDSVKNGTLAKNSIQTDEAISCVYCHSIESVEDGDDSNINHVTGKNREFYTAQEDMKDKGKVEYKTVTSWFGLVKESTASPYHKIDYSNNNYYTGNVCMGCHSHTNNKHSFDITMLDAAIDEKDKNTCVTCHMPQVAGTKVTLLDTPTHAFHGIAGIYHKNLSMGQYVDFKVTQSSNGFKVSVINKSNHALFGQAFRQGILKAKIVRGKKSVDLDPFVFERTLGKDGKEVMPWNANMTLKDTLIYAKRDVAFTNILQKGDVLELTLGVQRISKDGLKELGLDENVEFTKFRILKTQKFNF